MGSEREKNLHAWIANPMRLSGALTPSDRCSSRFRWTWRQSNIPDVRNFKWRIIFDEHSALRSKEKVSPPLCFERKETREITGNSRANSVGVGNDARLIALASYCQSRRERSLISCQKAGRGRTFIRKKSREAHTATFPMLFAKYQYQLAIARRDRVIIKSSWVAFNLPRTHGRPQRVLFVKCLNN